MVIVSSGSQWLSVAQQQLLRTEYPIISCFVTLGEFDIQFPDRFSGPQAGDDSKKYAPPKSRSTIVLFLDPLPGSVTPLMHIRYPGLGQSILLNVTKIVLCI